MERSTGYPTIADVRAEIAAQRARLPRTDASGVVLSYNEQRADYRDVISRAQHERAHGGGRGAAEGTAAEAYNPAERYSFNLGSRDLRGDG